MFVAGPEPVERPLASPDTLQSLESSPGFTMAKWERAEGTSFQVKPDDDLSSVVERKITTLDVPRDCGPNDFS